MFSQHFANGTNANVVLLTITTTFSHNPHLISTQQSSNEAQQKNAN